MHNHDAESEACLNRQILNNCQKESNGGLVWKTAQTRYYACQTTVS